MEGLFEANRIAEVSLSKLSSCKSGDVSLRRTLLISKVLNTAHDVATSAHASLLTESSHSTSRLGTSRLMASFAPNPDTMDSLPASLPRKSLPMTEPRPKSPISQDVTRTDDESMDFENMNSILSSILLDTELEEDMIHSHVETVSPPVRDDLCAKNLVDPWSVTVTNSCWEGEVSVNNRPMSPGKRNYQQAFPYLQEGCELPLQDFYEDTKRFKSSNLESVPGFCGYLSSKNLQTAPFITYMFGRGFSKPSNLSAEGDWPDKYELAESTTLSLHSPPILAF